MAEHNEFDIFISHASEDKSLVARPLAIGLRKRGFKVWYDEFMLKLGDGLRESIDRGIRDSRFGVVVLSPAFFGKKWTNRELDGLTTQEVSSGKTILPVWHNVAAIDVAKFSPTLANRYAVSTKRGMAKVINEVERAVRITKGLEASPARPQLQQALVARLRNYLIELGAGFRYIGSGVPIAVDRVERSIDLLFYHTRLRCYVVIGLSSTGFQPELAGTMLFLTGAVDRQMKEQKDSSTLGMILCTSENRDVADCTLRGYEVLDVSEYQIVGQNAMIHGNQRKLPVKATNAGKHAKRRKPTA